MNEWVVDTNGNKCSLSRFGSTEAAQRALDSLVDCHGCVDCSGCRGCSRCSDCAGCCEGGSLAPVTPTIEDIHAKVYAMASAPNALNIREWHSRCRTSWVVHLAGDTGYRLEQFHDTALAAQLIYRASGYEINPARFYDSNEAAVADMQKLAEQT